MTDETEGQVDDNGEDEAPETPPATPEPSEKDGNPTEARAVLEHRARLSEMDKRMAK